MQMPNSSEESGLHGENSVQHVKEDSEYVRLVISDDPRPAEGDTLQPQPETRTKSPIRWIRTLALCILLVIIILIFLKWGVPFLFEKVPIVSISCSYHVSLFLFSFTIHDVVIKRYFYS